MSYRELTLPADAFANVQVGDELRIEAQVRVIKIVEDIVDISPLGHHPGTRMVPAERQITLFCTEVHLA